MDPLRQYRWLFPPFFFATSLALGARISGAFTFAKVLSQSDTTKDIVGLLAATGVAMLPLGFLISTASAFVLYALGVSLAWNAARSHEVGITTAGRDRLHDLFRWSKGPDPRRLLYALATFDHQTCAGPVHEWGARRWHTFNTAVNSAVALVLAWGTGPWLIHSVSNVDVSRRGAWAWLTFVPATAFLLHGFVAWRETMQMIDFQLARTDEGAPKPKATR